VRHNPQAYYVNLGGDCARYNIPLTDPPDLSARFTLVTPNLIHDMHDGTVGDGDAWLSHPGDARTRAAARSRRHGRGHAGAAQLVGIKIAQSPRQPSAG
jgi:hypothetical protein